TANGVVESPQWAAGGHIYFSIRRTQAGRESLSIARQTEGGQPEVLVDGGYNPTVSADESTLVYLKTTRAGQAMMKKTIGEPNAQPSSCGGDNRPKPSGAAPLLDLARLLEPSVAYAHGLPADVYSLGL